MKKTNKNIVHAFDPLIYPRMIWIAITTDNVFKGFEPLSDMPPAAKACVEQAYNVKDNLGGLFIRFSSTKIMDTNTIAHESTHAAMEILRYIGGEVDLENQEYFAYLVGWIADCCEKVKKGKF